jgi:hypothetical protein
MTSTTRPEHEFTEAEEVEKTTNRRIKNQAARLLIQEWMADESGYDEEVWPIVRQSIEANRTSYRNRFSE